jgi:hypothetical protein
MLLTRRVAAQGSCSTLTLRQTCNTLAQYSAALPVGSPALMGCQSTGPLRLPTEHGLTLAHLLKHHHGNCFCPGLYSAS